jgi:hypothetical protein
MLLQRIGNLLGHRCQHAPDLRRRKRFKPQFPPITILARRNGLCQ